VSEHIERLVQLLKAEEGGETADGSTAARARGQEDDNSDELDDEDNRIEEV